MRYWALATCMGIVCTAPTLAAELEVRNVRLVDTGHITSVTGTVINISDQPVAGATIALAVAKANQVISRMTVAVPPLEPGQAWRLWQPLDEGSGGIHAISAKDPQVSVTTTLGTVTRALLAQ